MLKRIKELIELLKLLYIKIAIMCKSDCQVGRDNQPNTPKTPPPSPSNDDNHVDETRAAHTSII
jgi:hypothetical protein